MHTLHYKLECLHHSWCETFSLKMYIQKPPLPPLNVQNYTLVHTPLLAEVSPRNWYPTVDAEQAGSYFIQIIRGYTHTQKTQSIYRGFPPKQFNICTFVLDKYFLSFVMICEPINCDDGFRFVYNIYNRCLNPLFVLYFL